MSIDDFYVVMDDLNLLWTLYCVCEELYAIVYENFVYKCDVYDKYVVCV
jgi:hypothetical protein